MLAMVQNEMILFQATLYPSVFPRPGRSNPSPTCHCMVSFVYKLSFFSKVLSRLASLAGGHLTHMLFSRVNPARWFWPFEQDQDRLVTISSIAAKSRPPLQLKQLFVCISGRVCVSPEIEYTDMYICVCAHESQSTMLGVFLHHSALLP